jgi:hypothetical protein
MNRSLELSETRFGTGYNDSETGERYVFSIAPHGYEEPINIPIEVPSRNIDRESVPPPKESTLQGFRREFDAFQRLLPGLLNTQLGRFVAVHNGQIIDEDEDEFALAERVERAHRSEFVLIRQVLQDLPEEHLNSPEIETR